MRVACELCELDAVCVDPCLDVGGLEADEVAPLDEGDAAFVDEAANVADLDAEALGDGGDVDEVLAGCGWVKGWLLGCP